jgi:hypothetical protein
MTHNVPPPTANRFGGLTERILNEYLRHVEGIFQEYTSRNKETTNEYLRGT